MNRGLLDPFASDFPATIEDCLDSGAQATVCAFNRRGSLLAVGCVDGRIVLWDFETRGVAAALAGHVHAVTAVGWSRSGRRLLSAATDWTAVLWDVLAQAPVASMRFDSLVLAATLHPRGRNLAVACVLQTDAPYLLDLDRNERRLIPQPLRDDPPPATPAAAAAAAAAAATAAAAEPAAGGGGGKGKQSQPGAAVSATFDSSGDRIYWGNARGVIAVVDTETLQTLSTVRVPGGATIKTIGFNRTGEWFLVNSGDRILRVYNTQHPTAPVRDFQDVVDNRLQWKKCCFSAESTYVAGAGSAQTAEHNIYIWNLEDGQLVKMLEGPKEGILDLVWHPGRPIIASVSTSGSVYIWATHFTENWSAFAPDFTELEENEEYVEREDEFDLDDDDAAATTAAAQPPGGKKKRRHGTDETEDVDILHVDKGADSDEEELFVIPCAPIPDS